MNESRNPYHQGPIPSLRNSVFAYFDILGYQGFATEAYASGSQTQALGTIYGALNAGREWLEEKHLGEEFRQAFRRDLYALKAFTDNIVIGWPIHDDAESELGDAFGKLIQFQFQMALAGFFVRGAIAVGDAYVDDIVVFGDALLEAHQAETTMSRDPRIILARSAVQVSKQHLKYYPNPRHAPHVREVLRDADGQWFLNYLEAVLIAEEEAGPFYEELLKHKAVVESKLSLFKHKPPIWSKYAWVAGYHNYFCDAYPRWFDETHRINLDLFRSGPTLILDEAT